MKQHNYLQPRVYGEAASSRVHAGDVLGVGYIFQLQLLSVVPEASGRLINELKITANFFGMT